MSWQFFEVIVGQCILCAKDLGFIDGCGFKENLALSSHMVSKECQCLTVLTGGQAAVLMLVIIMYSRYVILLAAVTSELPFTRELWAIEASTCAGFCAMKHLVCHLF